MIEVRIEWLDPKLLGCSWMSKESILEHSPCLCSCRGIVIKEDDDVIIVAGARYEDDYAQIIVLPKGCIVSIVKLKADWAKLTTSLEDKK